MFYCIVQLYRFSVLWFAKCDPPRENREKGECTDTRAMTRHAKRVTIARICAYLISKTKSGTVSIVWQSKAFVSSSERNVTLNVQYDTRAKRLECEMARVSDTEHPIYRKFLTHKINFILAGMGQNFLDKIKTLFENFTRFSIRNAKVEVCALLADLRGCRIDKTL